MDADPCTGVSTSEPSLQILGLEAIPIADLSITEAKLHNEIDLEVSPTLTIVCGEREADHRRELLHHFSHKHPLILCEKEEGKEEVCKGCLLSVVSINDPIYRCSSSATECEELFLLHKSCAELPQEMFINSFHQEHSFQLFYSSPAKYICDLCDGNIRGLSYSCRLCDFDFHITCASQLTFEPQGHEHSFIMLKPTSFTCDVCGEMESEPRLSRLCTTCQLQVHTRCSYLFPLTVKIIRHSHKLSFTYLFQLDFKIDDKNCKICNRQLNSVFCVYYCEPCGYIAHMRCATSKLLQDEYGIEEGDTVETKEEIGHLDEQLQHFSHPHCLILSNDEPKIDQLCDGCAKPISVPFYTCVDQCNFMLHKQCVELPTQIQHPLHRHPLTLQAKTNLNIFGIFDCYSCDLRCNGFTYTCGKCYFFIDVGCSFFQNTLRHEGHQCDLSLVGGKPTQCSACGFDASNKFICEKCNFEVDFRCVSLPKTTWHKCPTYQWDTRPFKLTYYSVEDEPGEYYCDICEERRGRNHWFYYCEDCDYFSHPQCILGKELIKFGKIYRLDCHPHSLTLVKVAKAKKNHPCAKCGSPIKDYPILICTECDVYFHYDCCLGLE